MHIFNPIFLTAITPTSFFNLATPSQTKKQASFLSQYLSHFHWDVILSELTSKAVWIIFLCVFFLVLAKGGKALIKHFFKARNKHLYSKTQGISQRKKTIDTRRNETIQSLSANIYYYVVVFCWIYSILSVIGIPVGTLLAGAGIFSLAIGLGAQGFVSDIVSGFFIICEHQIAVGEQVIINNISGKVAAVGLRTTQIRSGDGTLNFIPNRNITTIANLSRGNMQATINLDIAPETPIEKVETIIKQVNDQLIPDDSDVVKEPVIAGPTNLPDGALAIQVQIICKNGTEGKVKSTYLQAYLIALQKAGIKLPMPPLVLNN